MRAQYFFADWRNLRTGQWRTLLSTLCALQSLASVGTPTVAHGVRNTGHEKIKALWICIGMLDDNSFDNFNEIKKLRRIMYDLKHQEALERLSRLKQSDIRAYF